MQKACLLDVEMMMLAKRGEMHERIPAAHVDSEKRAKN